MEQKINQSGHLPLTLMVNKGGQRNLLIIWRSLNLLIHRVLVYGIVFIPALLHAQEFWSGTKNTTTTISRTGITNFGYTQIRNNDNLKASIIEHTNPVGDLYIRSSINVQDGGNIILNDGTGNVGIGTTHAVAKLTVNGNILAREIKVKTDITVPDYVFEKDYQLPSLTEVEAYVKEHKHLPEIPSAREIGEEGLDVAKMNLLLLKKVEELMLIVIEQQKELNIIKKKMQ
ncbi:hypothetical protein GCM10023231_02700 [Olivibacter ginsenosidimutans]|uniref:Endosialidase-like protein n=2 Tax=Olivibacter ginsenosidimutans TaxID=1176537 RepID=A0ABP9AD31_9SPHI